MPGSALVHAALTLAAWTCDDRPLVLTRASIWSASGVLEDREILVQRGRVSAMGPSGSIERPENARVLNAAGATVLPGLLDAHAHFVWPAPVPETNDAVWITARQTLASGVTTVLVHLSDLVEDPLFQRLAQEDCFPAPRIERGGRGLIGGVPDLEGRIVWGVKDAEVGPAERQ